MQKLFIEQLKAAITACQTDYGGSHAAYVQARTTGLATIERIVGRDSIQYEEATKRDVGAGYKVNLLQIAAVCHSLYDDLRNGYLRSMVEVVHADVFADYLEMADHLNSTGYKDAAAVIAGSTLEAHIKSLCEKYEVPTKEGGRPVKADMLNSNLVKADVYGKLDQKNVTAWLDLRNNAAHGDYSKYDQSQVSLLIQSVRDFIVRNPA